MAMCDEYGIDLTAEHYNLVKSIANENGEVGSVPAHNRDRVDHSHSWVGINPGGFGRNATYLGHFLCFAVSYSIRLASMQGICPPIAVSLCESGSSSVPFCLPLKNRVKVTFCQVRKNDFISHIKKTPGMFGLLEKTDPESETHWQNLAITAFK